MGVEPNMPVNPRDDKNLNHTVSSYIRVWKAPWRALATIASIITFI